ncbi:universal stress protein [Halomicrococcus gelatinilyticus]|uniref:universal stress protein n=1 Tax=Halomicrococcus gelatinilyticus TaxID=1702103 RepID=UPI002E167CA0
MTGTNDDEMTVLVPVEVLDGEQVPAALIDVLASVRVVLLGYHAIPDQTAPEQARAEFGEQARAELNDLVTAFRDAGVAVEARFVFTPDPTQTFERVALEEESDAILLPNPAPSVDRILVPLSEDINVDRITAVTAMLTSDSDVTVTLTHVAPSEEERARGERLLDEATKSLVGKGVAAAAIDREVTVSETPIKAITEVASDDTDLVIIGESRPSVRELVFGEPSERIAGRTLAPVLVVRRLPIIEEESDAPDDAS